jgi:hypothetical protein
MKVWLGPCMQSRHEPPPAMTSSCTGKSKTLPMFSVKGLLLTGCRSLVWVEGVKSMHEKCEERSEAETDRQIFACLQSQTPIAL